MALVIEGCDCSGKTTLAKSLDWPIMTSAKDMNLRGEECLKRSMDIKYGFDIWVRWWLTELVYSKVMRREQVCSVDWKFRLKLLADRMGVVILWMDPSKEELMSRYNDRNDDHSLQTIYALRDEYRRAFHDNWQFMPHFHTHRDIQSALVEHYTAQKQVSVYNKFGIDGWGTLNKGCVLFCGEKLNENTSGQYKLKYPFDYVNQIGSGTYFFDCLIKAGAVPGDTHIMNLWRVDDSQGEIKSALRFLEPRIIISLGTTVKNYFDKQNRNTILIPHPQHQKRFESRNTDKYIDRIAEIIQSDC